MNEQKYDDWATKDYYIFSVQRGTPYPTFASQSAQRSKPKQTGNRLPVGQNGTQTLGKRDNRN